jgi:xanthine/CO dehydrogenase XdhC/CoxF family maturation factor
MDSSLTELLAFFDARRDAARPLVLATVIETEGSTYRKAGARMLIDDRGDACGLLSGGCLESDLAEHARRVLNSGVARLVEYDLRGPDDLIWGIGLGCEGAMRILMQRLSPGDDFAPLPQIARAYAGRQALAFATVVRSQVAAWPPGRLQFVHAQDDDPIAAALVRHCHDVLEGLAPPGMVRVNAGESSIDVFIDSIELPPRILILGAGPDAKPVVGMASTLGWPVTVYDHRPAYAVAGRFPQAQRVVTAPADELAQTIDLGQFDAAVVMSHHLPSDLAYLRQLASTRLAYVGLLGPEPRRQKLLADVGARSTDLSSRIFGPVGLDIGARTPEAIALAIVAEIHAVLARRSGGSFSRPK